MAKVKDPKSGKFKTVYAVDCELDGDIYTVYVIAGTRQDAMKAVHQRYKVSPRSVHTALALNDDRTIPLKRILCA